MVALVFGTDLLSSFAKLPVSAAPLCPQQCSCDDINLEVRCTHSNLDVIPIILNPNLRKLILSDNQIRKIRKSSFEVYQSLELLDLSGNALSVIEDSAFFGQHKLKVLKLERNAITLLTNQTLNGLHSLETLQMNDNQINNITDSVFSQLSKLETLDLTRNRINFLSANAFRGLSNLRHLYLRDNRLGDESNNSNSTTSSSILSIPALNSEFMPILVRLDLGLNNFSGIRRKLSPFWSSVESSGDEHDDHREHIPSKVISSTHSPRRMWPHLEELHLDGCSLRFIESEALNSLRSLLILRIQTNHFEEIPTDSFNDVSNLQVLQIGQNPFEKINAKAFTSLTNLKSLDISNCPYLTRIDPFAFVNNDKLQRLELSHNPMLRYLDPEMFTFLVNLKYLSLRANALSTLDSRFASIGNQVEILDIRDNPFTCNCSVQWIRKLFIGYRNQSSFQTVEQSSSEQNERQNSMQKKPSVRINYEAQLPEPLRQSSPNKSSDSHSSQSSSSTRPTIKSYTLRVIDVKCANPPPLRAKLLIDLDPDDIGCFEVESMAPIVIAVIIACLILFGVIIICCISCRTRLTFFIKGTSAKNHYPNKYVEPVNNNRKVFGFSSSRRINDLEYQYSKPECIVVHNVGNIDSSAINNLNNPYEITPVASIRESIYATLDEGMGRVYKSTPTTEL
ncbi:leucine-rich repeat-containing protein 4B-like protein [Dinothrombium tinctorium]|uniref:Leucine-rich repeat-containing protein 4B-like protein n=1 Tax=Dinothrombium tinctorium TaxID=1965070 RepID=A0A3S3QBW7_9ACAR|nr:leucine-rich repeat-containing protein 4B-like protein [Dinothrombium tinctorium]RWS17428.1 leucine-rich repeat-containing protein 4B-like protein [Dinothrombium tinctorium]RWS17829.1 leucine-rich repeat-containing protein 4B-like protein [Dinothrombium tinctorium]RWS17837.1 leucine-rich repeat-containing protein 4B-like protein [Dinothrombium tinctorium]